MSVYPHLDAIADPKAKLAMKTLFDRLAKIEQQAHAPKVLAAPTAAVSGTGKQRVMNLADPVNSQDAVNLRTARTIIQTVVNNALQAVGIQTGITVRF